MNIFENLDKLKNRSFTILFGTLLLIASGIQVIFFFNYNLFINLDLFKLILLSITFGLGLVIIPFLALSLWVITSEDKELEKFTDIYVYIFITAAPFAYLIGSISLLISYLFGLSFKVYVLTILTPPVFIAIFVFLSQLYNRIKSTRSQGR